MPHGQRRRRSRLQPVSARQKGSARWRRGLVRAINTPSVDMDIFSRRSHVRTTMGARLQQLHRGSEVVERTGLTQIVHQPTRGANILDRVYVSDPQLYSTVRVVTSVVKSDHKAVVAFSDKNQCAQPKTTFQRTYRRKTPSQHALFLQGRINHCAICAMAWGPPPQGGPPPPGPEFFMVHLNYNDAKQTE